ncbi:hypothetical protein [Cohnella nanjingensis]|uniref:Uncharacterized protein n=1 Tax=Cohnella nanjingensis TaxID=1387779 RepID=A0A7X0RNU9_9BACL|nr:hypothetical protein [Cohnella nanjingensis]MBB6670791.1 hypothetical protein [Cohnella nanjingensis]
MTKNGSQVLDAAWSIARDVENRGRDEAWFAEAKRDIAEQAEVPAILQEADWERYGMDGVGKKPEHTCSSHIWSKATLLPAAGFLSICPNPRMLCLEAAYA